jgi:type IV pilus assembly protein PilF
MNTIRPWLWMFTAVWAILSVALLSGCSGLPAAPSDERAWLTQTEESETRRRARVRLELAAGYLEQGQTMVALDEVNRSLAIDPHFAAAHNLRGLILMEIKEPQQAEASFQQALRIAPRDGDTWHNLGWFHCQQERYAEAVQAFGSALQSPAYASAARTWMVQGLCQARAGQLADAEASLGRAFQLDASNPITLYNLALLLHKRDEHERARFYLRRLNNSDLANAESLWLGVRIERRLQNPEAVQQLGRQLMRRFPQSREASAFERGAFHE